MYEGNLQAWKRMDLEPLRVVAYTNYVQSFRGSKRTPKTIKRFWPLPFEDYSIDVGEMKDSFAKAKAKLNKQKNGRKTEVSN